MKMYSKCQKLSSLKSMYVQVPHKRVDLHRRHTLLVCHGHAHRSGAFFLIPTVVLTEGLNGEDASSSKSTGLRVSFCVV